MTCVGASVWLGMLQLMIPAVDFSLPTSLRHLAAFLVVMALPGCGAWRRSGRPLLLLDGGRQSAAHFYFDVVVVVLGRTGRPSLLEDALGTMKNEDAGWLLLTTVTPIVLLLEFGGSAIATRCEAFGRPA
jgi:hypothetical protein